MVDLLGSELFRDALIGGTTAAVVASATGFFLSLRALAFTSEALTDIGFAGATGGVLLGVSPLLGMLGFTLLAVLGLGALSERLKGRDVETGMVLSLALGFGVLFLSLYAHSSASHSNWGLGILFGSITSIQPGDLILAAFLGLVVLLLLALFFRPLLFSSLDPVLARSRGVSTRVISLVFLLILALATSVSILVVGVLLTAALMIAPATAALNLFKNPYKALGFGVVFALLIVWIGIFLAFFFPVFHLPISFYIAVLASALYFFSIFARRRIKARASADCHFVRETRS
jgi:zinc/manganese transport system permease protein